MPDSPRLNNRRDDRLNRPGNQRFQNPILIWRLHISGESISFKLHPLIDMGKDNLLYYKKRRDRRQHQYQNQQPVRNRKSRLGNRASGVAIFGRQVFVLQSSSPAAGMLFCDNMLTLNLSRNIESFKRRLFYLCAFVYSAGISNIPSGAGPSL